MGARWLSKRILAIVVLTLVPTAASCEGDESQWEFFEKKIRPMLVGNCYTCHSADTNSRGGLRVDDRNGLLTGGGRGPAIVPGKPEESVLIRAVRHTDEKLKMPPETRLAEEQVADLDAGSNKEPPGRRSRTGFPSILVRSTNNCGRNIGPGSRYAIRSCQWSRRCLATDPIDRFLLARMEEQGLTPVGDAGQGQLIRRVTFDLTGLPPRRRRSRRLCMTSRRKPSSESSIGCSLRRRSANAGAGTGWTWPATANRPARRATCPIRMPGGIATTSSTRSTPTSRTTSSSASRSPATCCRASPAGAAERAADRHRLSGARREGRQPAVQGPLRDGQHRRADRHGQPVGAGPDGELCPLPRSQVRSDSARRTTTPGRHLPQHRPVRRRAQQDGRRRPGLLRHRDAGRSARNADRGPIPPTASRRCAESSREVAKALGRIRMPCGKPEGERQTG